MVCDRPLRQLVPGTADRTCGARAEPQFLPSTDGISWHDISPRVGIACDLFGTGKTALKGSPAKPWQGRRFAAMTRTSSLATD